MLGVDQPRLAPRARAPAGWTSCAAPGTAWACRSWSSCTVHSTSVRPPRPSLKWVLRVGAARQPLGLHPGLEGADLADLARRRGPPSGQRSGSMSARKRAAEVRVAGDRAWPAAGPGLPDQRPALVVGAVASRALRTSGPLLPSGRRSASRPSCGSGPGADSSRRSSWTTSSAWVWASSSSAPSTGLVHEHHVGVASRSRARRRRGGPCRRRAAGSTSGRAACARSTSRGQPRGRPRAAAAVRSVRARADPVEVELRRRGRPRRCGTAPGAGSRARPAPRASGSSLRPAADRIRRSEVLAATRGVRPPASPRIATLSGARTSRSAAIPAAGQGVRQPLGGATPRRAAA